MWHGARFSARNVYHHLQELEGLSDTTMLLKCSRIIWKCRILLKIKIFGWLLLRQRLMTRSFRQRFCLRSPAECPFAQATWRAASTSSLDVSTAESFWYSIARGRFGAPQNGTQSSLTCGRFGYIGTRWSSEVDPRRSTVSSTMLGESPTHGIEAASASRILYLCNRPCVLLHYLNEIGGGVVPIRAPLLHFSKKK